jgi:hypothetical protein
MGNSLKICQNTKNLICAFGTANGCNQFEVLDVNQEPDVFYSAWAMQMQHHTPQERHNREYSNQPRK